jgi:3-hydroxymyristoyl/3-hydroxydecanoyl-(acyl carrier protein) dehydratase
MAEKTGAPFPLPCSFARLVPHKPPIRINGNLVEAACTGTSQTESAVAAIAPLDGTFVHRGQILPEYFIELLAQSAAALHGYCAGSHGKPQGAGFLVSIDRFTWHGSGVPNDRFHVTFREIICFDSVHLFEGAVRNDRGLICEGRFKIWADIPATANTDLAYAEPGSQVSIAEALARDALIGFSSAEATGTFNFAGSFPGFLGHFPGNPVLPAVFQTAAVQLLAERLLDTELTAVSASNIKFVKTIHPGESARVSLRMQRVDAGVHLVFSLTDEADRISSGELTYSIKRQ